MPPKTVESCRGQIRRGVGRFGIHCFPVVYGLHPTGWLVLFAIDSSLGKPQGQLPAPSLPSDGAGFVKNLESICAIDIFEISRGGVSVGAMGLDGFHYLVKIQKNQSADSISGKYSLSDQSLDSPL